MPAIASKCYKAGEVIVECKPIVHCVKEGSKGKYCDHCLKESVSLKKCSKCLKMYYCGKECQSTDWKYHKYECKVFKNPKFKMESSLAIERLVLRLWLFAENNPTFVSKRYKLFDGSDVSLNGIEFDAEKLKRNKLLMMAFAYICDRLKTIGLEFETEKLFYWYGLCNWGSGVFTINKIAKYASDLEILSDSAKIVSAIYIELVKVGHSCLPNGDYVTDGPTLQLRAMRDIESGQTISYSFCDLFKTRNERKEWFKDFKPYECRCDKCRQNLDKNFDYDEFHDTLSKEIMLWRGVDSLFMGIIFNGFYGIDWDLILMMRHIFGTRYHSLISEALVLSFICFVRYSRWATKTMIDVYFKEVEESLLVTHGSEHSVYKLCRNIYQRSV